MAFLADVLMIKEFSIKFDAQWYLAEYPDVRSTGIDPFEHFQWLGRRLNRLPCPPEGGDGAFVLRGKPIIKDALPASRSDPYCEDAVLEALDWLTNWLAYKDLAAPAGSLSRLGPRDIFDAMRWDFGHSMIDGVVHVNPNSRKLVDFMHSYEEAPSGEAGCDLNELPQDCNSILLVSYYVPTRAHAGGLRLLDTYSLIRQHRPNVHLTLFVPRHEGVDGDLSIIEHLFDDVHYCYPEQFRADWLVQRLRPGQRFDLVDLQFHQAGVLAPELRHLARRMIFTPMETLSRFAFDEVRDSALRGKLDRNRVFSMIHNGAMEREIVANVDLTVCVSDADANFLMHIAGQDRISHYPTGLSSIEFSRELASDYTPPPFTGKRNRLVFAAYFSSETNRYGLQWYLEKVHPRVLAAVPDYDLAVVGRGDTSSLETLMPQAVCFIGEVPNLAPVLEQAKGGLVLALNGSGFRGKINQYSLCGLPSISTPLGATGLTYTADIDILIAEGPEDFSKACIDLLLDEARGARLAQAARLRALKEYSWEGIWPRVAAIYGLGREHDD